MEQPKSLICHNTLLAVTIVTIGAVEAVALFTGHNGAFFNLAMGAMVALAGGAPTFNAWVAGRQPKP